MKILVLGGTRFIGPPAVRRLSEAGHRVAVFHRGQSEPDLPEDVEHIHGDRRQLGDFREEFSRFGPDVVLDMRPITESDARLVMDTLRGIARRVVTISSADVYRAYDVLRRVEPGPPDPTPLREDSPLRTKLYPYRGEVPRREDDPARMMDDYDKILVERVVLGAPDLPGTSLRLPMVYGEGDYQHRNFRYLKRMADRRPAIVLEEGQAGWRTCRGYVGNVAASIALAVTDSHAAGTIYNVADRFMPTEAEHVRALGDLMDWHGEIVVVPADRMPAGLLEDGFNPEQDLTLDTSRIRDELGYVEPVSTVDALRRTITWEVEHPPEPIDPAAFNYALEDEVLAAERTVRSVPSTAPE
ncbi:MAG TPA: NAD-dependent epimerase/dehydratase family protein [Chloroflexota bacterium]